MAVKVGSVRAFLRARSPSASAGVAGRLLFTLASWLSVGPRLILCAEGCIVCRGGVEGGGNADRDVVVLSGDLRACGAVEGTGVSGTRNGTETDSCTEVARGMGSGFRAVEDFALDFGFGVDVTTAEEGNDGGRKD